MGAVVGEGEVRGVSTGRRLGVRRAKVSTRRDATVACDLYLHSRIGTAGAHSRVAICPVHRLRPVSNAHFRAFFDIFCEGPAHRRWT